MLNDLVSNSDKSIERERYNQRAVNALQNSDERFSFSSGIEAASEGLRAPLQFFIEQLSACSGQGMRVLEIGAGTGAFTTTLVASNADVTASDISEASLQLLQEKFADAGNLEVSIADMESLPFKNESFDMVSSAGSLSYGDNDLVRDEIYRVLKSGGRFIALDSLNHNPLYRLNRWVHYLRGRRTLSTLKRMPRLPLIEAYRTKFGDVDVHYFGSISWMVPMLSRVVGGKRAAALSDWFDGWLGTTRSSFKFVMVVSKE